MVLRSAIGCPSGPPETPWRAALKLSPRDDHSRCAAQGSWNLDPLALLGFELLTRIADFVRSQSDVRTKTPTTASELLGGGVRKTKTAESEGAVLVDFRGTRHHKYYVRTTFVSLIVHRLDNNQAAWQRAYLGRQVLRQGLPIASPSDKMLIWAPRGAARGRQGQQ